MIRRASLAAAERAIARCGEIAACTEIPGQITRPFLCPSARDVHRLTSAWMTQAGMSTHIDAAGNLRGFYAGREDGCPRLIVGSHLDTVPNAGAFDGVLGLVLGIATIEELQGERLPFSIEVIGFSEEEGVRYRRPFLGSMALLGRLDDTLLRLVDDEGTAWRTRCNASG